MHGWWKNTKSAVFRILLMLKKKKKEKQLSESNFKDELQDGIWLI